MKKKSSLLLLFLRGSKKYFGLAAVFACVLVLFELVNPKIIGYTVDYIIEEQEAVPAFLLAFAESLGGRDYVLSHLWILAGIVVLIALFGGVCRYLFQMFNSMGAEMLVRNSRDRLYTHIVRLPYKWHDINKTGDIIQRCTSDVDMIKNFIANQLTTLIRMLILVTLSLFFMLRINVLLTLVGAAFFPVVILYSFIFHNKVAASFQKIDEEEGRLSAIAQENLTGVRVVRAFGREKYEKDRFETKNEKYTWLWIDMMRLLSFFWGSNDLICGIQAITVMSLGAYLAVQGQITAGQFVTFMSYNGFLIFPIRQLGRVISEMSKAGISMDRLQYIMDSEAEQDAEGAQDFPGNGEIVFDHVTFRYETEGKQTDGEKQTDRAIDCGDAASEDAACKKAEMSEPVLKDLTLRIQKGETIGVLGATGSGKSTLIHLLDGLYDLPENSGKITIGGVDIAKIRKKELRRHIGIVLQEPYLFSRTLEDNIRIAAEGADHADVERVVETASLKEAILKFTEGYETFVGERGVTLSGGQKQRTAIAQMLIRRPEIMIFDDSLSAVDSQTDRKIRKALRETLGSRNTTVLLISHRITTIMNADRIFVIHDGQVVEEGTHEELLQKQGKYKYIYDLQLSQGEEA